MNRGKTEIILVIFIFLALSCSNDKLNENKNTKSYDTLTNITGNTGKDLVDNESEKNEIKDFFISNFAKKFTYKNIKKFEQRFVETKIYNNSGKINGYIISENDFGTIFQKSEICLSNYDYSPIYYSIQNEKGYQSITVIGMDDDWCFKVCLLNYNMDGKLIGNVFLYESGGDGGYSTDAWGEYINDSIYIKTKLDIEPDENDNSIFFCDSIINEIKIDYKGKITTQELFRKRVQKKR